MQLVTVLRPAGMRDCTNGGLSGQHPRLRVVEVGEKATTDSGHYVVKTFGPGGDTIVVPATFDHGTATWQVMPTPDGHVGPMFGGNYVVLATGPVKVFDRFETVEQYAALSSD